MNLSSFSYIGIPMSNKGIPMWVFQFQPRNSEAKEPTSDQFLQQGKYQAEQSWDYLEDSNHCLDFIIQINLLLSSILIFLLFISYGKKDPSYQEFTWVKSSIFVLSSMTQRGWDVTPSTTAARIAFLT